MMSGKDPFTSFPSSLLGFMDRFHKLLGVQQYTNDITNKQDRDLKQAGLLFISTGPIENHHTPLQKSLFFVLQPYFFGSSFIYTFCLTRSVKKKEN